MRRAPSKLKAWFSISVTAFLVLILVSLGLPALLLLLRVPSFTIGDNNVWILRWQNDPTGSGIQFNLLSLLAIAIGIGLISLVIRVLPNRHN